MQLAKLMIPAFFAGMAVMISGCGETDPVKQFELGKSYQKGTGGKQDDTLAANPHPIVGNTCLVWVANHGKTIPKKLLKSSRKLPI